MSSFPNSPRLVKGGIVPIDPNPSAVVRTIPLQDNPDTLTRTLQIKALAVGGDRFDAIGLIGPPVENIQLDVEIDATDQLESPDKNRNPTEFGIQRQFAVLGNDCAPGSATLGSL
jgi:hypothetical protein